MSRKQNSILMMFMILNATFSTGGTEVVEQKGTLGQTPKKKSVGKGIWSFTKGLAKTTFGFTALLFGCALVVPNAILTLNSRPEIAGAIIEFSLDSLGNGIENLKLNPDKYDSKNPFGGPRRKHRNWVSKSKPNPNYRYVLGRKVRVNKNKSGRRRKLLSETEIVNLAKLPPKEKYDALIPHILNEYFEATKVVVVESLEIDGELLNETNGVPVSDSKIDEFENKLNQKLASSEEKLAAIFTKYGLTESDLADGYFDAQITKKLEELFQSKLFDFEKEHKTEDEQTLIAHVKNLLIAAETQNKEEAEAAKKNLLNFYYEDDEDPEWEDVDEEEGELLDTDVVIKKKRNLNIVV